MLSSIGRAAIRRVVPSGHQSTNRSLQSAWLVQRVAISQYAVAYPQSHAQRSYATTTKAAPKSKTSATAKPKTAKAPAKKAAKKPVKKPTPKPKKKAGRKPIKKPVKKPVKPKRVVPTELQKIKLQKSKAVAEQRQLKATALELPKTKPANSWLVFHTQRVGKGADVAAESKAHSAAYKALSPAELESLNHTANQNKLANQVALKQWVESHTPDQIRLANNARNMINRAPLPKKKLLLIKDDRHPKKSRGPYLFFLTERYASGDMKGIPIVEATKLILDEYKALSPSQRKVYQDLAAADRLRYARERDTVFPQSKSTKTA